MNGDGFADLVQIQYDELVREWSSSGDGRFTEPHYVSLPTPTNDAPGLTLADLNGDGTLDVVGRCHFALGRGDGSFGPTGTIWGNSNSTSLTSPPAVADLNGDGKPDYLLAYGYIKVRLGVGSGVLDSAQVVPADISARLLAVADLNHDDIPDVVIADGYSTLEARPGLGNGSFGTVTFTTATAGSTAPVIVDIDRDGHPDIVFGRSIYRGAGDGSFAPAETESFDILAVGDFDGDGSPDLAGADSSHVLVARGTGGGHFGPAEACPTVPQPREVHAGDANGDGIEDLFVISGTRAVVAVHLGQRGQGLFRAPAYATGAGPIAIASHDFDGDGIQDLLTADRGSNTLTLLAGLGGGAFASRATGGIPADAVALVICDTDQDGIVSAFVACDSSNVVAGVDVRSDLTFGQRSDFAIDNPSALAVADLDENGRPDVLIASRLDQVLWAIQADDLGGLQLRQVMTERNPDIYRAFRALAAGDFDADGHPDVAIGRGGVGPYATGVVEVVAGDGHGGLVRGIPLIGTFEGMPAPLCPRDLNGDGRMDLIAVEWNDSSGVASGDAVGVIQGTDGRLTKVMSPPTPWGFEFSAAPSDLAVSDVNGDGLADAVIADPRTNAAYVLAGESGGTFRSSIGLGAGDGATALAVADLDGDGWSDLAVACSRANTVVVLRGIPDEATPVLASLISTKVEAGQVLLSWHISTDTGANVRVQRATGSGSWGDVANLTPDGSGNVTFADRDVVAGTRYGYRIGVLNEAALMWAGETWVDVPVPSTDLALALESPVRGGDIKASFVLRAGESKQVQLLDLAGRVVVSRQAVGTGNRQILVFEGSREFAPGIYFVRVGTARSCARRVALLH